jgi:hypothetical protein
MVAPVCRVLAAFRSLRFLLEMLLPFLQTTSYVIENMSATASFIALVSFSLLLLPVEEFLYESY